MENKVYQVNAGGNIYDIDDRQADIDIAQLQQDIATERERAELAERQLQEEKQSVVKIVWGEYTHIDQFITPGVYDITGERLTTNDGLPIANASPGHTIAARLTVLSSSIKGDGAEDDKCITQMLVLSNRTGGDGKVYIRTGRASTVDMLAGGVGWKPWSQLQQNIEVGAVATYDNLTDNGIYSGVYVGTGSKETFVLVVINDYALATQLGVARHVSQFKYSVYTGSNVVAYHSRVWDGNVWSAWSVINVDEIASMINAAVAKLTNVDAELITRIQALASWVEEHGVEAAQLTAAITAESQRALAAEEAINNRAVDADTLNVAVDADALHLDFATLDDGAFSGTVEFPAATAKNAGVMSAADKIALETVPDAIEEGERRALRRLFVAAGAEYNDTDSVKEVSLAYDNDFGGTKVQHLPNHYRLNSLGDITEEEMLKIYNIGMFTKTEYSPLAYLTNVRTNLGRRGQANAATGETLFMAYASTGLVTINLCTSGQYEGTFLTSGNAFYGCSNLRAIYGRLIFSASLTTAFAGCTALERIKIYNLKFNALLDDSPLISKISVLYMIQNAQPTSAITITLHPDAYARLANDADIVAALESQPLITLVSA